MLQAPWLVFWPGLALSLAVFGVNMLEDALRDILDPRLRGGPGRLLRDKAEEGGTSILAGAVSQTPMRSPQASTVLLGQSRRELPRCLQPAYHLVTDEY